MFGDIISAGLSFLGGQQTNQKSWDIAQASNQFSAEQAQKQMDFQERMRSTQYQTAVDDLKKAGLNPMLAYSQGGAGTPSGAAGSSHTAPVRNALGEAVTAYLAATQNEADVNLKNSAAIQTNAQTAKTNAEIVQIGTQIEKILADTDVSKQTFKNLQATLDQIIAQVKLTSEQTRVASAQTGKTIAEEKNITANVAPSGDPFWYRDLKKVFPTPSKLESLIRDKYLQFRRK